jgi:hypothetical protein
MITFLPFADFQASAESLDRQRLGKQRAEVKMLVQGHLGLGSTSTLKHPASKMWLWHTTALIDYGITICREWRRRGYSDSVGAYLELLRSEHADRDEVPAMPPWLDFDCFHSSHRSRLVDKDPRQYRDGLGWTDDPDQPYLWPLYAGDGRIVFRVGTTRTLLTINYWGRTWSPNPIKPM